MKLAQVIISIIYALHIVWTGLWRNIEAQAYKPNSLWFCMVMGLLVISSVYLYRLNRPRLALIIGSASTFLVLGFYLYCLISNPATDATVRVGLIILTSLAHLVILFLPAQSEIS